MLVEAISSITRRRMSTIKKNAQSIDLVTFALNAISIIVLYHAIRNDKPRGMRRIKFYCTRTKFLCVSSERFKDSSVSGELCSAECTLLSTVKSHFGSIIYGESSKFIKFLKWSVSFRFDWLIFKNFLKKLASVTWRCNGVIIKVVCDRTAHTNGCLSFNCCYSLRFPSLFGCL